jgi:hypothetical protein
MSLEQGPQSVYPMPCFVTRARLQLGRKSRSDKISGFSPCHVGPVAKVEAICIDPDTQTMKMLWSCYFGLYPCQTYSSASGSVCSRTL